MNKTLALLAALGIVATAPAFADDSHEGHVKKDEKAVEKTVKDGDHADESHEGHDAH